MPQHFKQYASPLIIALVLGLLVPTFCVLWFMLSAMESERIASLKRLEELHHREALNSLHELEESWLQQWSLYTNNQSNLSPAVRFKALVNDPLISSSIIWGEAGTLLYPQRIDSSPTITLAHSAWRRAQGLEFSEKNYDLANTFYTEVLALETAPHNVTAVHQALSRLAYKMGNVDNAIAHQKTIIALWQSNRFKLSLNEFTQRNPAVDAHYRILELLYEANNYNINNNVVEQAIALRQQLLDYDKTIIPASQRLFLMNKLNATFITPDAARETSRDLLIDEQDILAETLAAHFAAQDSNSTPFVQYAKNDYLRLTAAQASIFIERTLFESEINKAIARSNENYPLKFSAYNLQAPASRQTEHFFSIRLDGIFEGLTIAAQWKQDAAPNALANTRVVIYIFTGCTVIVALFLLYFFVVMQMRKQEKLQQLRSDVIATISHELKTPLASIRLLIDNLQEGDYSLPSDVADYIAIIRNENYRLSNLVDNFMIFSRMERDKHVFSLEHLSLKDLIDTSLLVVAKKFAEHHVTLSIESTNDELYVEGDESLLQTTIINLLDNAYKYSGDNKKITLKSWCDAQSIYLAVIDNGIGISEKDMPHVFDRFFRVDQRLSRHAEGCGLGLNISRYIIQKHGGTIRVDSTLGKGSTFTIQLPR